MNAKLWICAAGAVIMALACTREVTEQNIGKNTNEIEFTASWAQEGGLGSRTALQENGTSIWWTTGEEINAFFGTMASGKFTSTNTEPQATANFTGTLTSLIGDIETEEGNAVCWAIYPYNEANTCDGQSVTMTLAHEQEAVASTFADKFFPAVAKSNSFSLAFYNVCGGVRFSVTQEGVRRVIFKSNDGSPMAGKVRVGFGEDNRPEIIEITDPVDSILVIAPEGGAFTPGAHYFAAMLPQTHAEGINIYLQTIGKYASTSLTNVITVHRSTFGLLDNLDDDIEYNDIESVLVDLGLSVKWASCNLCSSGLCVNPEETGDYFAWGEVKPRTSFSTRSGKWYNNEKLIKYCTNSFYGYNGFIDNKTVLDTNDDAAHVILGENWRMPTNGEVQELLSKCIKQKTTLNGVTGYKLTRKGKWIFLPYTGERRDSYIYDDLYRGYYWSSSLYSGDPTLAIVLTFSDNSIQLSDKDRWVGLVVRPVYDE